MEFKIYVDQFKLIISRLFTVLKAADDFDNCYIEVMEDMVKFYCHNNYVYLAVTSKDAEIIETGSCTVGFKNVYNYVSKFSILVDDEGTEHFHFSVRDDKGSIKTKTLFKNSKPSYKSMKLKLIKGNYRKIDDVEDVDIILNSDMLRGGIEKTASYIDKDGLRYAMSGLNFIIKKDSIVFVGTDGRRLSEYVMYIDNTKDFSEAYILNSHFVTGLYKLLDKNSQVFLKFENGFVYLKCNNIFFTGSLLVGEEYPNYKTDLEGYEHIITVPYTPFIDGVSSLMGLLDKDDFSRMTLEIEGGSMRLSNNILSIDMELDTEVETPLLMDVNGILLLSLLNSFSKDSEVVDICFTNNANLLLTFKVPGDDDHKILLGTVRRR